MLVRNRSPFSTPEIVKVVNPNGPSWIHNRFRNWMGQVHKVRKQGWIHIFETVVYSFVFVITLPSAEFQREGISSYKLHKYKDKQGRNQFLKWTENPSWLTLSRDNSTIMSQSRWVGFNLIPWLFTFETSQRKILLLR